jgi:hypothetical protein
MFYLLFISARTKTKSDFLLTFSITSLPACAHLGLESFSRRENHSVLEKEILALIVRTYSAQKSPIVIALHGVHLCVICLRSPSRGRFEF